MTPHQPTTDISASFLAARRAAAVLTDFPGQLPGSLGEAYKVQDASIAGWQDEVAGWKVGGIPPSFAGSFGETRLAGPIFRNAIQIAERGETEMPAFEGGFAAVEGEIVLELGQTIAPGAMDPSANEVFDLIHRAFLGVEIASSPLSIINDLGPLSIISDFGNNGGLLVGDEIENWRNTLAMGPRMEVTIDDKEIGSAPVPALEEGAVAALRFLIRNCAERGITLAAGTYVSTGAVTGVHRADIGSASEVRLEGCAPLKLRLTPRQPIG